MSWRCIELCKTSSTEDYYLQFFVLFYEMVEFILYRCESDAIEMEGMKVPQISKIVEEFHFSWDVLDCCAEMEDSYLLEVELGISEHSNVLIALD